MYVCAAGDNNTEEIEQSLQMAEAQRVVTTQCESQVNLLHWKDCIMQMLCNLVKPSSNIEHSIGNPETNCYVTFHNEYSHVLQCMGEYLVWNT